MHLNRPDDAPAILDFHRFVLLFTHRFSDRIRFVGELELEHAFVEGLEEAGELELEQAYLDFLLSRGGLSNRGIAAQVGCSPPWVRQVIHRLNDRGLGGPCALHRSRSHPGARRTHGRAPARRLGRQRHQDRDA